MPQIKDHLTEKGIEYIRDLLKKRREIIQYLDAANKAVTTHSSNYGKIRFQPDIWFYGMPDSSRGITVRNDASSISHCPELINATLKFLKVMVARIDAHLDDYGFDVSALPQPDIDGLKVPDIRTIKINRMQESSY